MTHLIAQVSNRAIFGTELCRNKKFLHSVVQFAETVTVIGTIVHWTPVIFRGIMYFVVSRIFDGKQRALSFIIPFLKRHTKDPEFLQRNPTIAGFLIRAAPSHETTEGLAIRLLNVNFGSIHTSSIFMTQVLFELALLSQHDLDSIRDEINEALEVEGGWTKLAVSKFSKVDSALREVGRVYGLAHLALPRIAVRGYDLRDGTRIPPGQRVAMDMKTIHSDPTIYPNPDRCDLFRFSKLRAREQNDTRHGFATIDSHYLPFGAGRHACAGRFFAATVLKIMIAHILLNYDIKFPPGTVGRPANIMFNGATIPDAKTRIVFKPRHR